jgi:hypothetical protein
MKEKYPGEKDSDWDGLTVTQRQQFQDLKAV